MDIKHISWYLGAFLLINGFLSLLPVLVALYYNEPPIPMLISSVTSCIFGVALMQSPKQELSFGDAMLLVSFSFLVLSFFGAIPFFMILEGDLLGVLIDGYFESISGYTTTGLTVLSNQMLKPSFEFYHSIVFGRVLSEWLGGLGIIVIFMSILAKGGISTVYLHRIESSGSRIAPSIEHTARIIIRIYLFYTLIGAILLWISGLDFFHSIVGVMSVLSTGGFIGSLSRLSTVPWTTDLVLMLCMVLGAVPFALHYTIFSGDLKKFFQNVEIRTFFWVLSLSILILLSIVNSRGIYDIADVLHRSALGVVSAITSTGYSSAGLENIGYMEVFLLMILMLIGGCSGSTAGGLKFIRISVLIHAVQWLIKKYSLPETAVVPLKVSGRVFHNKELMNISLFFFIYVVLIFFGNAIFMLFGIAPMDAVFLSVSAQGTNGLSRIEIAPLPLIVKLVLIFQMIAGRLEILPVLALTGFAIKGISREILRIEKGEENELETRLRSLRRLRGIK